MPAGAAITSAARDGLTAQPAAAKPGVTTGTTRATGTASTAGLPGIATVIGAVRAFSATATEPAVAALTTHT